MAAETPCHDIPLETRETGDLANPAPNANASSHHKPATLYASDQVFVSIDALVSGNLHLAGNEMPAKVVVRQENSTTRKLPSTQWLSDLRD